MVNRKRAAVSVAPPSCFDESGRLAAFEEHRNLLFSIAYRMLGSVADAEDTMQDAFIRWQWAPEARIQSTRAYLVTIVSRLCINQLTTARAQREQYVDEWLPKLVVTEQDSAMLDVHESISLALLLTLERLKPSERAVFLLSEVFDYKHADIASILGFSQANCRQLLRRARQHICIVRPTFKASARDHIELLERFVRAVENGDMAGLLGVLASNIMLHADGAQSDRLHANRSW